MERKLKFLLPFVLILFSVAFVSAPLGYNSRDLLVFRTSGLNDLTDVSIPSPTDSYVLTYNSTSGFWIASDPVAAGDTNETTRFNALAGTDCSGTDKVIGVQSNGTVLCDTDVSSGGEPNWNANYSVFLTHITWASATNGTLYLSSNPYTFYNQSNFNITDYTPTATLLGFAYYNATSFPYTALSNFTDDLGNRGYTHLSNFTNDLSFVNNNTAGLWLNFSKIYSLDWTNVTITESQISDFGTYLTSESDPNWLANYSDFLVSYNYAINSTGTAGIGNCPDGQVVMNTTTNGVECITPSGSGDITSVRTISNYLPLNNTESGDVYLNLNESVLNTTIGLFNTSLYNWVVAQGYTAGGITWADAVNGTLALNSSLTNPYIAYNYTTNGTFYLASNPSAYVTNATVNKTVACSDIIGSPDTDFCTDATGSGFFNASGDLVYNNSVVTIFFNRTQASADLEVNGSNYWDGLDDYNTTHFTNTAGVLTLVEAYINSLIDNEITMAFVKALGFYNTTEVYNKTEINDFAYYNATDFSITDYRQLTNNTFVSNITISNNYLVNQTNGGYIYHNGTGWVIVG